MNASDFWRVIRGDLLDISIELSVTRRVAGWLLAGLDAHGLGECGPVPIFHTMSQGRDAVIANDIGIGQRDVHLGRRIEHELNVLQAAFQ